MRTGLLLLIFLGLYGCKRPDFHREIQTIDSLARELRSTDETLKRIDTNRITHISAEIKVQLNALALAYEADTLSEPDAHTLIAYKSLGLLAPRLHEERLLLQQEAKHCHTQLRHLKEVLEKNAIDEPLFRQYALAEKQATETLLRAYEAHRQQCLSLFSQFDSLHPVIIQLIGEKENSTP